MSEFLATYGCTRRGRVECAWFQVGGMLLWSGEE